jgi:hypothetical protein
MNRENEKGRRERDSLVCSLIIFQRVVIVLKIKRCPGLGILIPNRSRNNDTGQITSGIMKTILIFILDDKSPEGDNISL